MKSFRQILRQPLKSLSGVLLVALAVAVMCVSVSQTLAAANTSRILSSTFMTVALPAADVDGDIQETIDALIEENPHIFREDIYNGLASAYIEALRLDNHTEHLYQSDASTTNSSHDPDSVNYSNAMFEVTVTDMSEPAEKIGTYEDYIPYSEGYWYMEIEAEIVSVIGLQEGYDDPVGRKLRIEIKLPDQASMEAFLLELDLNNEDRYIVYGSGYEDLDWALRCHMAEIMMWREEPELLDWELDRTEGIIDFRAKMTEENAAREEGREPDPKKYTRLKVKIGDLFHGLSWEEMAMFRTSCMSVGNMAALPRVESMEGGQSEDGSVYFSLIFDEDGYVSRGDAALSDGEYAARYEVPMMAKLEGTAEEFLAENPQWQKMLDNIEVNSSCFPVIGIDGTQYVAQFALGRAEIVEGRDFSEEEIASGAKLCLISKSLAQANGLSVGDTINPQFYQYDSFYPAQSRLDCGEGLINVSAQFYNADTTALAQAESYTIIGLYEQDSPWCKVDDDYYAFTPNTVFVPKASVGVEMEYSSHGMFRTLVVESDRLLELQLLIVEKNLDGLFYFYDNGYNAVARQLDSFRDAAQKFLPVGLVMYAILILLFIFLFPGRQGRELAMMDSMGCTMGRRLRHVLLGCLGIAIPGTALGTGLGLLLWQRVSEFLIRWVETDVALELNSLSLWAVAALQIVFVAALALAVAVPMAKKANLMKRR